MTAPGVLAKVEETGFRQWYAKMAKRLGLDPNPDNPLHFYDWRAAFRSGAEPDENGHWPSTFKRLGHPRLIVEGMDTRTMQPATDSLRRANAQAWLEVTGGR
jgi:hypothetical protein